MNSTITTLDSLNKYEQTEQATKGRYLVDFDQPQDYIDVGHSKLAYWKVGQGPNLVLVHGWPISSATYRNMLPYLSEHFTCHLFDFPGAGKTLTGENAPFGLTAHAKSLLNAIKLLEIKDYALLGHDSGAAIMQIIASLDKENVKSMVMGNTETPGYYSFMMRFLLTASRLPKTGELLLWSLRFKALRYSKFGLGEGRSLLLIRKCKNDSKAKQKCTSLKVANYSHMKSFQSDFLSSLANSFSGTSSSLLNTG